MKKYKHVFADMDGTITRSRTPIGKNNDAAIAAFTGHGDFVVVSGATREQIIKQVGAGFDYHILAQNGNHAFDEYDGLLWKNELNWLEKHAVFQWCYELIHTDLVPVRWGDGDERVLDLVQDRGCQISFSVLGHNAKLEDKEAYDPKREKRREILQEFPFEGFVDTLDVKIGGTTCFDFFRKGNHKGLNVKQFIDSQGWDDDDCVYIGDALDEGGNDESVKGIIHTIAVKSPEDLPDILEQIS